MLRGGPTAPSILLHLPGGVEVGEVGEVGVEVEAVGRVRRLAGWRALHSVQVDRMGEAAVGGLAAVVRLMGREKTSCRKGLNRGEDVVRSVLATMDDKQRNKFRYGTCGRRVHVY